jgi:phosphoribosyl-AMP cyclohydrolase / phosphoribosyl-ATP pyrophosphohydrolase
VSAGSEGGEAAVGALAWDERGLLPVVAQDASSGDVLMLAYADREALARTLEQGEAHFFSRSRGRLWRKGETSGHLMRVQEVRYDCDADALLYRVEAAGPACHTGARSCFFRRIDRGGGDEDGVGIGAAMGLLQRIVEARLRTLPAGSYVTRLHERGAGYAAQKLVEEAGETVVAALQGQDDEFLDEAADLLFHLTVLVALRGHRLDDVARVLARRHRERGAS